MDNELRRERELVLDAIQYAFVLDKTKGNIISYVGPHKTSLSGTDEPVIFDPITKSFKSAPTERAVQQFIRIKENSYGILDNPSERQEDTHPKQGSNNSPRLLSGRRINIAGPAMFPLWPTQTAIVIEGHQLRSNQYLVVRVYNETEAKANWKDAVIRTTTGATLTATERDLTVGQTIIIKGTEVSFYIPPTGIEVVPDENGKFVRDAVTLERLEYSILLDENGNKQFRKGPDVVFPEPTEMFVTGKDGARKFRAIELSETTGLYVKVIAEYTEAGKTYKPGDELFITGKDTMIYYPRAEHAIVKYGDTALHYAIAIPEGEGRYVLDRNTGKIELVEGPKMFLPDPRSQVIVRRVLTGKQCQLLYPGNKEAMAVNAQLEDSNYSIQNFRNMVDDSNVRMTKSTGADGAFHMFAGKASPKMNAAVEADTAYLSAVDMATMSSFQRKTDYTPPRTITLDTKYEGAITVRVWTGYAVLVVSKKGDRRVEVGPKTILLNYDESLEPITLSTGKPKTTDKLYETVYLRVAHNKVADVVQVETSDLVKASVKLSYKVNFEGAPENWFNVENYVKFLCDHMRSVLKNAAKKTTIADYYKNHIDLIRDTLLGKSEAGKERNGKTFVENGMRLCDVEVLAFQIDDSNVAGVLTNAQRRITEGMVTAELQEKELELTRKMEAIKREIEAERFKTSLASADIRLADIEKLEEVKTRETTLEYNIGILKLNGEQKQQEMRNATRLKVLEIQEAENDQQIAYDTQRMAMELKELEAQTKSATDRAAAYSPNLVAALQNFADKELAGKMAQSMAPLAILGGRSITEVFTQLITGTPVEKAVKSMASLMNAK